MPNASRSDHPCPPDRRRDTPQKTPVRGGWPRGLGAASERRGRAPGLVPRRGLAALVLTTAGLALLLQFKTPSEGGLLAGQVGGAPDPVTANVRTPPGTGVTDPPSDTADPTDAPPTDPVTPAPTRSPARTQEVTGQLVRTPYGDVQVRITLTGSHISDVQALQLPNDRNYSRRISAVVEPMLHDETLQAQSANIDLISGATYTSQGYAMSLQSALDKVLGG
jgi:uncharacterized protein with FMN-binding domain